MRPLSDISFSLEQVDAVFLRVLWSWRVPKSYRPLLLSLFGDWFIANSHDRVHMLDLVCGQFRPIAESEVEFFVMLDTEEQRHEWLMSHLVEAAEQAGIQRSAFRCFAFRTPPSLGGPLSPANLVLWDFAAYQTGTSKLLHQVADLPIGTQVIAT